MKDPLDDSLKKKKKARVVRVHDSNMNNILLSRQKKMHLKQQRIIILSTREIRVFFFRISF